MTTGEITVAEVVPTTNLDKLHFVLNRNGTIDKNDIYNELRNFSNIWPQRISDHVIKHGIQFTGSSDFSKWHIECGNPNYKSPELQYDKTYRIELKTMMHGYSFGVRVNNLNIGNRNFDVNGITEPMGNLSWNNYMGFIDCGGNNANLGIEMTFILENRDTAFKINYEAQYSSTEENPNALKGSIEYHGSYLKHFELSNGRNATFCNGAFVKIYEIG